MKDVPSPSELENWRFAGHGISLTQHPCNQENPSVHLPILPGGSHGARGQTHIASGCHLEWANRSLVSRASMWQTNLQLIGLLCGSSDPQGSTQNFGCNWIILGVVSLFPTHAFLLLAYCSWGDPNKLVPNLKKNIFISGITLKKNGHPRSILQLGKCQNGSQIFSHIVREGKIMPFT